LSNCKWRRKKNCITRSFIILYLSSEKINVYKILVRNPERKRPFEIHRRRWENNIKMYLEEIGWEDVN